MQGKQLRPPLLWASGIAKRMQAKWQGRLTSSKSRALDLARRLKFPVIRAKAEIPLARLLYFSSSGYGPTQQRAQQIVLREPLPKLLAKPLSPLEIDERSGSGGHLTHVVHGT